MLVMQGTSQVESTSPCMYGQTCTSTRWCSGVKSSSPCSLRSRLRSSFSIYTN